MAYGTTPTGSDTVPLGSVYVPGTSGGNMTPLQGGTPSTDSNSNPSAPVMAQLAPVSTVSGTLQSAAGAIINGATLSVTGMASCVFTVTGTFVGTVTFKGISQDGVTTANINCTQRGVNTVGSTATAAGLYECNIVGLSAVQAPVTAWTSGSITVTAVALPVPHSATTMLIASNQTAIPISGSITATNPSVGTDGAAIPTSSTLIGASDGTNLQPLQVDASKFLKVNVAAGSLTASNPSVGTDGSAIPTSSTLIGASDGTNLQQLLVESATNRNLRTGIYSGANEATVTASNALKVDGSAVTQPASIAAIAAGLAIANFLPVTQTAQPGEVALYASNPTALTANTDAAVKWGASGTTQVNHVLIANNTTTNINYRLDAATTAGSDVILPNGKMILDIPVTALHLQSAAASNINGTTAGNIVVIGWL